MRLVRTALSSLDRLRPLNNSLTLLLDPIGCQQRCLLICLTGTLLRLLRFWLLWLWFSRRDGLRCVWRSLRPLRLLHLLRLLQLLRLRRGLRLLRSIT